MPLIDDVKESIPKEKYIELCNTIQKVFTDVVKTIKTSIDSEVKLALLIKSELDEKLLFKENRKITLCYGITPNSGWPRYIKINDEYAKRYATSKSTYYYRTERSRTEYRLRCSYDISNRKITKGRLYVKYRNVDLYSFDINDCTITIKEDEMYNN